MAAPLAVGVVRKVVSAHIDHFQPVARRAASPDQGNLFTQLGAALPAFYNATVKLGVAQQVTTFAKSDFGRTFQPSSGGGSDDAWGSHHLVIGGAVRGGEVYGAFPEFALGGPSDADNRGVWIPATALDQ